MPVKAAAIRPTGVKDRLTTSGQVTARLLICLRAGITDGCGPLTLLALGMLSQSRENTQSPCGRGGVASPQQSNVLCVPGLPRAVRAG